MSRGMRITKEEFDANQAKRATPPGVKVVELPAGGRTGRPAKNKYGAIKTTSGDSRLEANRFQELRLLEKAGKIRDLIAHVSYPLIPAQDGPDGKRERAVRYTCDAQYVSVETGRLVIEDSKSEPTRKLPAYVLRRKLLLSVHGIQIKEV